MRKSFNTCKLAMTAAFVTLSYCLGESGSGNRNRNAHVAITKEVLRIMAYLNVKLSLQIRAKLTEERLLQVCVFCVCVCVLGSLAPAPGLNIRGAAAEKTGCMGPCTQPACGAA